VLSITLTPADALSSAQIAQLYALAERAGFAFERNYFERAHFVHKPTLVMAYLDEQLLGFQSYNLYMLETPFFKGVVPFIYGGLAFQDDKLAGRGLSYRLSLFYVRQTLGRFFFLRRYAFAVRTPTPRLMQILSVQHQLVHFKNGLLTPEVVQFAQRFAQSVRRINDPIDNRLIVQAKPTQLDITDQWPTLFRSTDESFNQLAIEADLIRVTDGRYYLTGKYVLVLGYSSLRQLLLSLIVWGRNIAPVKNLKRSAKRLNNNLLS
jgi:hypothetical protein